MECVHDEERLILRYSSSFRLRALVGLFFGLLLGVALLAVPLTAIVHGRFLEIITWGSLLIIIGGVITCFALSGWLHMLWYGWREVVFDHKAGVCVIPLAFFRHRRIECRSIEAIRIKRNRLEAGTYRNIDSPELWATHHRDRDSLWLMLSKPLTPQRLWGRLGLPDQAEEIGERIAEFLGKKLQRQPSRHFERRPDAARG